jgi:tetratricopeptide (TPR) repeat protein
MHAAIAAVFPADPAAQRDVAADHLRIADMLWADARYADALTRYRESMVIYERLAAEDATRLEDRFNVTRSLNRMGQLQMNAGNLPAALKLYQQSKALTADLSAAAPGNVAYRRGFAVAALKIGDVADRLHDAPTAFSAYVEAERITRQLSHENSTSADLRRTFALALGRLAIGYLKVQRAGDAVTTSREALEVYRTLVAADPENAQTQLDLADTYGGLGEALNAQGHAVEAADAIRHGLATYASKRGYAAGGGNLANLYLLLGDVLCPADPAGALDAYQKAAELFAVEPVRSEYPAKLAESHAGIRDAQTRLSTAASRRP